MKKKEEQNMKRLSRKQLASLFNRDPTTVSRWLEKGLPRNKDGTFNGHKAIKWACSQWWFEI
jgi:phage terminase Nu1 subunit (DNA packaging protein)